MNDNIDDIDDEFNKVVTGIVATIVLTLIGVISLFIK